MAKTLPLKQPILAFGRDLPGAVTGVYGELRGRIDGDLQAIAYAEDGTVRTVEEGGLLRSWDSETGHQTDFAMLSEVEACWAFSPDGRLLASGSNGISIWDVADAVLLGRLSEPSWMLTLAFSPDGKTIASGHDDNTVRLWDSQTGQRLHSLKVHQDEVCALAFSWDGRHLATAGEDRLLAIWDVETGKLVGSLRGHTDRVDSLAWNGDGSRLASAGWDTSVRVWDPVAGELLAMLNGQGECVHSVAFVPGSDNRLVCGDSDCVVRVWDYQTLKILNEFRGHHGAVKLVAIRADGGQVATGGTDRSIQFWDIRAGKPLFENQGALTAVHSIAISPTGELAALHAEGLLSAWDLATCAPKQTGKTAVGAVAVAASSTGEWALGSLDGRIAIAASPFDAPRIAWPGHQGAARILVFSPDGSQLASSASTDGTVKLWNAADGEPVLIIPEATRNCTIEAVAYHPREPHLAAAGINWLGTSDADGLIAIWNWRTHKLERVFEGGASRIAFSPDGRYLAAVSLYESIVIWDLATGQLLRELAGRNSSTNAIAFDSQGQFLASGSDDFGLRIWSCRDWSHLATHDLETAIKDLAFTSDGAWLITGNGNSTCYRIDLEGLSPTS